MSMTEHSPVFLSALSTSPHAFLQPSLPLHTDVLAYLKHVLDPIAADVSAEQQRRLQEARRKRKRGQPVPDRDVLRLKEVHTDGLGIEQVWEQARRVVDAARREAVAGVESAALDSIDQDDIGTADGSADSEEYEVGEVDGDSVYDGESGDEDAEMEEVDEDGDGENVPGLLEDEDHDMNSEELDEDEIFGNGEPAQEFVSDKFGLNDGFFSIEDFNQQSEFLEQQDARGEGDGAASDEEDVDWDTNPLGHGQMAAKSLEEEDGDEGEDDGPTFGDPDAPSEDEDDDLEAGEMDDMGRLGNTNDITYADFFAPPAQKKRKNKKGRPNPHNFPAGGADTKGDVEEDVSRTMAAVHRDLFEDDEDDGGEVEEDAKRVLDPSDPRSRKSAHERRKAAIAEEIRKLEAANVAKRQWTLSGEARAADRPLNSLLEEDLDFERAGKPVPVITAEVSESIEELIKRRILAHDFQDIARRRPDDLATGQDGKRGRLAFELDDTKSKQGLAEQYEEEHLRRTDPNFVDVQDEKLAKEQKEIDGLWRDVCAKLDSLSSWHFRPKQPAAQLDIRVDAPTITMEDARPNAGGDVAGASQLAPQEIYKAGEGAEGTREEVVGKSGLPAGREELSRDEKKRRRRREKERIHKAGGNQTSKAGGKSATGKKEVLGDLKRGGVRVIGKKGEMTDVEGRAARPGNAAGVSAGRYKL